MLSREGRRQTVPQPGEVGAQGRHPDVLETSVSPAPKAKVESSMTGTWPPAWSHKRNC